MDGAPAARFDRIIRGIAFVNRLLPRPIRQLPNTIVMWDFRRRLRRGEPLV